MYQSLWKLYQQFSPSEKKVLVIFIIISILSGLIQVIGIASIFPFIGVATNPELIDTNEHLVQLKILTGISGQKEFVIFLGSVVLLTLLISNGFLALSTWLTMKFVVNTTNKFSYKLMQRYLGESYQFHLNRNSSELIKNLTSEVMRVMNGGILAFMEICSKGFTCFFILLLLIFVDPFVALIVALLVGGAYALIYFIVSVKISKLGHRAIILFGLRQKNITESLGGIKDLMVLQRQGNYLRQLRKILDEIIQIQVINRTAGDLPKYIVETVAFGGILIMTMYLIATRENTHEIMPMIALYGFAGIRLMPAMQAIYKATATLRHDIAAVDLFYNDLKGTSDDFDANLLENPNRSKLAFNKSISLNNISFSYPGASKVAIKNLNLEIEKNSSVGIVGTSGSGKSTLVDIILGLLELSSGSIEVDEVELNKSNIGNWQNNIGYVPQAIFLADSTIIENIAFGIPRDEINNDDVVRAAKMANIHDFIKQELEDGYETVTGERGIRLSGGQRQRIGIARALYHRPEILVFDEATSALDSNSEKAIMDAVNALHGQITIIMIAHRLQTVMNCDDLVWLEKGVIKAQGTYDKLLEKNHDFQRFVKPSVNE